MIVSLIFCLSFSVSFGARLTGRDESGMVTVNDVVNLSSNMCSALDRINGILRNPILNYLGLKKLIHSLVLPVPNPIQIVDPLGFLRFIVRNLIRVDGFLARLANKKPQLTPNQAQDAVHLFAQQLNETTAESFIESIDEINCTSLMLDDNCTKELSHFFTHNTTDYERVADLLWSSLDRLPSSAISKLRFVNPGGAFLTLGDVIRWTEFVCRQINRWQSTFDGEGFLGFFKIGNTWIPIRDFRYPLDPIKLVDPWGIRLIPGKLISSISRIPGRVVSGIRRLISVLFGNLVPGFG